MEDILFLLLPIAAISGWVIARASCGKKEDKTQKRTYEPAYYKGLNFLLNEQPDKAIDVFIHLLEVDSETVETHLALGSLFRKRGEVDRAIRIHQNLIARPTLDQEQRAIALLELGQDYMNAGLFDRAENLFSELHESGRLQKKALENLKEIYQQEKVWDKSLQVAKELETHTGQSHANEIAHYYCELAEIDSSAGESQKASEHIKKAKQVNPSSVRALMMEAALEVEQEQYKKALRLYQTIVEKDPQFISEILEKIIVCYRQEFSADELLSALTELFAETGDTRVLNKIVDVINQNEGQKKATEFLIEQLQKHPSLQGLAQLARLQRPVRSETDQVLEIVINTLETEINSRPLYCCNRCGFTAKTLHWQCPGCRSWGTIAPSPNQKNNHSLVHVPQA